MEECPSAGGFPNSSSSVLLLWKFELVNNHFREATENGDLVFDHGAPYFNISNEEAMDVVRSWEGLGLVAEWNEKFGCFDMNTKKFTDLENVRISL